MFYIFLFPASRRWEVLRGIHWQFLRLVDNLVSLDLDQYYSSPFKVRDKLLYNNAIFEIF